MGDRARDVLVIEGVSASPDIVGNIVLLPRTKIVLGDRIRPVDRAVAEGIGRSMSARRQYKPIEVCRLPGQDVWTIVDGAHRWTGAEIMQIEYLRCEIVPNDRESRREREVTALLFHGELAPLDRAAAIAEMYDLMRARLGIEAGKDGRAISAAARWQKAIQSEAGDATDIMSVAYGIAGQIGERLNLNERTIRRDLTLARRLTRADIGQLRDADHSIIRNGAQLLALAKLDDRERGEAVKLLVAGTVKTVAEATALHSKKTKLSPEAKTLSAFIGSFARMSLTEKKGALVQLAGLLTPALIETLSEAIDFPTKAEALAPDRQASIAALRGARLLTARLLEGDGVDDDEIEAAHDACEQALHACGPAISNEESEAQA